MHLGKEFSGVNWVSGNAAPTCDLLLNLSLVLSDV
jgi:hypothetical protein